MVFGNCPLNPFGELSRRQEFLRIQEPCFQMTIFVGYKKDGEYLELNQSLQVYHCPITLSLMRDLRSRWGTWQFTDEELDGHIRQRLELYPGWLSFSKWAAYLPIDYQAKLLKQNHLDLDTAFAFLDQVVLVKNE